MFIKNRQGFNQLFFFTDKIDQISCFELVFSPGYDQLFISNNGSDKWTLFPGLGINVRKTNTGAKMVKLMTSVFAPARRAVKEGGAPQPAERFMADERTNSIVMLASENDIDRARDLIGILDKKMPLGSERIRVYYLENAMAEDMAKVLQEVPAKSTDPKKPGKKTAMLSQNIRVMPDKATNSLIIMAEKDDFPVLEEMISKLDIPRAMVYIESLIMEVDVDSDFNFGAEWLTMR